jgi:hypothetical protein
MVADASVLRTGLSARNDGRQRGPGLFLNRQGFMEKQSNNFIRLTGGG